MHLVAFLITRLCLKVLKKLNILTLHVMIIAPSFATVELNFCKKTLLKNSIQLAYK